MLGRLGSNGVQKYHLNQPGANEQLVKELSEEDSEKITGGVSLPAKSFMIGAAAGLLVIPQLFKGLKKGVGATPQ